MSKVIAPGKCILFGEHAVVYGYPAIAMGVGIHSRCEIEKIDKNSLIFHLKNYNRTFTFSSIKEIQENFPEEFKNFQSGLLLLYNRYNFDLLGIRVIISSKLFMGGGLGSSASTSVALITALGDFFDLALENSQISDFAFEMEKIVHGTPSGIDNTICTYGNILIYQNKQFKILNNIPKFDIMITYTNMDHSTKKAIQKIADLREKKKQYVDDLFYTIGQLTQRAEKAIKEGDIIKMGNLMNKNQKLLEKLGVSNRRIERINKISLEHGLYGSKLTGAGLGGCVIGVGERNKLKQVSKILKKNGFKNIITSINEEGVQIVK
ncbi:MAG: mevalonate kinase [Promethearchaeia archaeon]